MYPQTYLSLFPPFPRSHRAFVAMSFAAEFEPRWQKVLRPALGRIEVHRVPLAPFRVDLSKASDAILTEILQAISESMVIVADVTAIGTIGGRAVRNANVLYEVGIAHASRRPEEVVLFRSDDERLDFDIQGVRVHTYRPDDDSTVAQNVVVETIIESLRAVESARRVAVRYAAKRLTQQAYSLLLEAGTDDLIEPPQARTMGQVLGGFGRASAIELLLDVGAIETVPLRVTAEVLDRYEQQPGAKESWVRYRLSPFGVTLRSYLLAEALPQTPELVERMRTMFSPGKPAGDQ